MEIGREEAVEVGWRWGLEFGEDGCIRFHCGGAGGVWRERDGGAKCVREAIYVPRGWETDRKLAMEFEFSCLFNELYIPLNLFQLH